MEKQKHRISILHDTSNSLVTLAIAEHGPIAKPDICRITGLSVSGVNRIINRLVEEGEILEAGTLAAPRGRKAVLYEINRTKSAVGGVWIGPESIEIGVADPSGDIIERRELTYEWENNDWPSAISAIAQSLRRCADNVGKKIDSFRGVGVTIAGLADPLTGTIENIMHRSGWEDVPIVRALSAELGVPVYLDHDIRAIALYHHWFSGEGKDGSTLYLLAIEGIGAAFVNDQGMIHGAHDMEGQIGHTTVEVSGPKCRCGSNGCLELYASDIAFIRYAWPSSVMDTSAITTAQRIDLIRKGLNAAKAGDEQATRALELVCRYLATGIANVIRMLDPRTVLICGTLVDMEPNLVLDMVRKFTLSRISPRARGVEIAPLLRFRNYLLKGACGLVLWQPYRAAREAANEAYLTPCTDTRTLASF